MATTQTPRDYYRCAMDILAESGFPAVTAAGLCQRMGLTRGSFYHHFANFDVFVEQFLEDWVRSYSTELISRSTSSNLDEQVERQLGLAVALPHAAEVALRAWATVDPRVAAAQHSVDQLRHDGLAQSLRDHGTGAEQAGLYATIALATLTGLQATMHPIDLDVVRRVFDELAAVLISGAPDTTGT